MSERVLSVRLRAVTDGYERALGRAADATDRLAARGDKVTAWGERATTTGRKLTRGLTLPIAGIGAAILKVSADFDTSMRQVGALTGAAGDDMDRLGGLAKKMGADTQFSAGEAADAMAQLARAGLDTNEIYEALPGVMQLAAAASLDIATAADIATNVIAAFGMEMNQLEKVNDILALSANSAQTDVRELGEAFKFVGPVASGAGLSLEETSAAMALLADAGIRGSMAGTTLRAAIVGLINPTGPAATLMESLGINALDAEGQLVSLADIIDQLASSGATTGDIMALFGQRAGPGMVALVAQGGDALRDFTGDLENAAGTAQDLADAKMGGLGGAILQLRGSIETLLITLGEAGLASFFESVALGATSLANAIGGLPVPVQRAGIAIAGVAAASGPAIWALGKMAGMYGPIVAGIGNKITALRNSVGAMRAASAAGQSAGAVLMSSFGPQALLLVGVAAIAGAFLLLQRHITNMERESFKAADAAEALADSAGVSLRAIEDLETGLDGVTDAATKFAMQNGEAISTLKAFEEQASRDAYLVRIGFEMVQRGASPEVAFEQVQRLADAAGVELPMSLTIDNIGDWEMQLDAIVEVASRLGNVGVVWNWSPARRELEELGATAANAWKTSELGILGFIQVLGRAEAAMGDNKTAIDIMTDEALKGMGEGFGFSTSNARNLEEALRQVASGATNASPEMQQLAQDTLAAAEASGEVTGETLAAAAAMGVGEINARDFGQAVERSESAQRQFAGAAAAMGEEFAESAEQVTLLTDALKGYRDTMRAAVDPVFALTKAERDLADSGLKVSEAQGKLNEALAMEPGVWRDLAVDKAFRDLQSAQEGATIAAFDYQYAATELNSTLSASPQLFDNLNAQLGQFVEKGILAPETAFAIAASLGTVGERARTLGDDLSEVSGIELEIGADDAPARRTLADYHRDVRNSQANTNLGANRQAATRTLDDYHRDVAASNPTAQLNANDRPARTTHHDFLRDVTRNPIVPQMDLDTTPARRTLRSFYSEAGLDVFGFLTGGTAPNPLRRSRGGLVTGSGSTRSDSIPAMLSNREFVVRASAVERVGVPALQALNDGAPMVAAGSSTDAALIARMDQLSAAIRDISVTNVTGNTIVAPSPERVPGEITRAARTERWLNA